MSFDIGHSWQSKHKSCPDKLVLIATKLCRYPENMKIADELGNAYVFPLQLLFLKATGGRYFDPKISEEMKAEIFVGATLLTPVKQIFSLSFIRCIRKAKDYLSSC